MQFYNGTCDCNILGQNIHLFCWLIIDQGSIGWEVLTYIRNMHFILTQNYPANKIFGSKNLKNTKWAMERWQITWYFDVDYHWFLYLDTIISNMLKPSIKLSLSHAVSVLIYNAWTVHHVFHCSLHRLNGEQGFHPCEYTTQIRSHSSFSSSREWAIIYEKRFLMYPLLLVTL